MAPKRTRRLKRRVLAPTCCGAKPNAANNPPIPVADGASNAARAAGGGDSSDAPRNVPASANFELLMALNDPYKHCPPLANQFKPALGELYLEVMRTSVPGDYIIPVIKSSFKRRMAAYCRDFCGDNLAFNYAAHVFDVYIQQRSCTSHADPEGLMLACIVIATKITRTFCNLDVEQMLKAYHMIRFQVNNSKDYTLIRSAERDIMCTMNFSVPTVTELTDLRMLNFMLMRPMGFPVTIEQFEESLVSYYLIYRYEIDGRMWALFASTVFDEFAKMMSNRYLVPCAVLYCVVRFTMSVNMNVLAAIFSIMSGLPVDSITTMAFVLMETFQKYPWCDDGKSALSELFQEWKAADNMRL